jgi:hypothetical protein
MRWLALSGLMALLPGAALAVDACEHPIKICTYDDATSWGGCRGEALRNLLKERDCLADQANSLKDAAAIADVSQVEPRFIARILLERKLISAEDSDWILANNVFTEKAIFAIRRFQNEVGHPADGWLRSDEFVRLTCETASESGKPGMPPYSKYYLGWMYMMGQGVEPSRRLALQILREARIGFNALNTANQYRFYLDKIQAMIDALGRADSTRGRSGAAGGPARDYCPDFTKFVRTPPYGEMDAKLLIPLPEMGVGLSDERAGPEAQPNADHE